MRVSVCLRGCVLFFFFSRLAGRPWGGGGGKLAGGVFNSVHFKATKREFKPKTTRPIIALGQRAVKPDTASQAAPNGCCSKLNRRGCTGFGPCFHLPGFHFGTGFLSHSHLRS